MDSRPIRIHKPERYPPGTPARALAEYADAWHRQDLYGAMVWLQRSWVLGTPDAEARMRGYMDSRKLLGLLILGRGQIRRGVVPDPLGFITFADVPLRAWYVAGEGQARSVRMVARLVYEGADGLPREVGSPHGSWGVNPVSMLDEDRSPADVAYTMSTRVG